VKFDLDYFRPQSTLRRSGFDWPSLWLGRFVHYFL